MTKFIFILLLILSSVTTIKSQPIKLNNQFGEFTGNVYDLCFYPSGQSIVIPESDHISLYNVPTNSLTKRLVHGHSKPILTISLSADTTLLASGGLDSLVVLWDISSGTLTKKLNYHHGVITSLNFNQDRSLLASGSSDKTVVVYHLASEKIAYTLADFKSDITSVKFSPDGQLLAVASLDKKLRLYDAANGHLITILKEHKSTVRALSFNKEGTRMYSCGDDSRFIEWNLSNKDQIKREKVTRYGSDWLLSLDVSNDSQAFVVAGLSSKIYVTTLFASVSENIGVPVNKIQFVPRMGANIKFAIATRGKGVFIMDMMKFNSAK